MDLERDLETITRQEAELQFATFDFQAAWQLGLRLRTLALQRQAPVVIEVRRFGELLFYCALPGSVPDNAEWIRRKSNLVARFHRSSYAIGLELKLSGTSLLEKYSLADSDFAAHGGAFPISIAGSGVVGSTAVSGLPQRQDHSMVVEALCLELEKDFANYDFGAGS